MSPNLTLRTRDRHVVVTLAAKGGLGVSTVALDWAKALGREGNRSLLVEIAGGDMAWISGGSPSAFTENVADGTIPAEDAAVPLTPHTDLLATGNAWAVYGAPGASALENLVRHLNDGPWQHWVIDAGNTRPDHAAPIWKICTTIAVVLDDNIASVSRTYALVRRLAELGWEDRLALVFNRISSSAQAEALRERFAQLTRQFLGTTWPLCGVVPDAPPERRSKIIAAWAGETEQQGDTTAIPNQGISEPAITADNLG
jgi:MinD-like ATPase involved in chromosome partitioning or flagellar assembly